MIELARGQNAIGGISMHILLIEDDPSNRFLCESFLISLAHTVAAFEDGESAWMALQGNHFDIILSDWSLPGLSGLEICRRLRGRKSRLYPYFIMISSFQGQERLEEAMEAGVDDLLSKPVDFTALMLRLNVARRILDYNAQIGILQGLLPICMYCKNIRNDQAFWQTVESYFNTHAGADFTHSLCPDCYASRVVPELGAS